MKNEDGSIDNELCPSCRDFDRGMNGGPVSSDVWVVCDHDRNEVIARLAWKELRQAINDLEKKFLGLMIHDPLYIEVNYKKFYETQWQKYDKSTH